MANRAALIRLARASARTHAPSASASPPIAFASRLFPAASGGTVSPTATARAFHFRSGPHRPRQRQRQRQRRSSSSSHSRADVTPAAADRRIAGRKRFYKDVGVAPASRPERADRRNDGDSETTVDSPVSAGVDGTQSATGVVNAVSDSSRWSSLLQPQSSPSSSPSSISWHTVTLDGRALRTPLGLPLALPSLPLALAVASEWDAQGTHLRPAQMPLMTLCCTAIDQCASDPSGHRSDVLRYLRNDTSCYWADPVEDRALRRRQDRAWDGLHDSVAASLLGLPADVRPARATGGAEALLLSRRSKGNPASGLPHPPVLVERARTWVDGLDAWTLTALYSACAESKSFFVGAALIRDATRKEETTAGGSDDGADGAGEAGGRGSDDGGGVRDGKWAVNAARVEEEFNIECWGLVEGGHDYDRLNCSIQMHAASFLARAVADAGVA